MTQLIRTITASLGPQHPAVAEAEDVLTSTYLVDSADFAAVGRWVQRDPVSFGL